MPDEFAEVLKTPLSNFAKTPIEVLGVHYATVEHFYQAAKTANASWFERIRTAATPGTAKRLGRACPLRADWEEIKEGRMRTALHAKYAQNQRARDYLLATAPKPIRESAPWDSYWGTGPDGLGLNRLGVLLVEVREQILFGVPNHGH